MSAKLLLGKPVVESIANKVLAYSARNAIGKLCAVGFDEPRWIDTALFVKISLLRTIARLPN